MAAYIATSSASGTSGVFYRECILPHHPSCAAKKTSPHICPNSHDERAARHLSDVFEQVTPFRGHSHQQAACGRLGITPSLAEQCCGLRLIESDSGPRAVSQRVVFASATLNDGPGF